MPMLGYAEFRARVLAVYRHRAPTTLGKARQVLDELERLGVCTTADLTTETCLAWLAGKGPEANPRTVRGLLGYLRAITHLAVDEGWLDRPPAWRRIRVRPGPPPPLRALRPEDAGRLIAHLAAEACRSWQAARLHAMVAVAAYTGLRYQELARLQLADVDLVGGWVEVRPRGRRLKTAGSAAAVPVPPPALEALRGWAPRVPGPWLFPGEKGRGPWSGGSVGYRPVDRLAQACAAAGVPRVTWHGLRHTFAYTASREWRLPQWAVQRVLRHSSPRTTERYQRGDDEPILAELLRGARYPSAGPSAA